MGNASVFLISLFGTFIFFRLAIRLISRPITEIAVHTREGFKFHHLHIGVVAVFLGVLLALLNLAGAAFLLFGFGLGAIFDEFIPSLYLKEPEPYTTALYWSSLKKTLVLFAVLALAVLVALAGMEYSSRWRMPL